MTAAKHPLTEETADSGRPEAVGFGEGEVLVVEDVGAIEGENAIPSRAVVRPD